MQATTVQGGANATVPEAPGAPAPGAVVAVGGAGGDPAAVYQGFSAQGKVLREQLEGALDERSEEIAKLTNMSGNDFAEARAGVQARIARLDKRIAGIEEQLLQVDAQTAAAAGVPGAVQPPPQYRGGDDDEESFAAGMALATVFIVVFLFARRRWRRRRGYKPPSATLQLPAEITTRMERLENIAESTALEVERIGEGQRFVTKLLSEQQQKIPAK